MPRRRPTQRLIELLCDASWLNRDRVAAWGLVLLVEEILLLGFIALWQHGVFTNIAAPTSSDFVSFYAAGKLALAGTPALAYDHAAHYLVQQQATFEGAHYQYFFYPPVFLVLCAGLAKLPYAVAYVVFQVATLGMFIAMMRNVLREHGWRWIPPLLAFPAVFWNLGLGQNAFLSAALFGGFTLLVDRRPRSAGVLLGMLCYKPHFGLLVPVALAFGRRWTAFFASAATMAALVGVSVLLFGWHTWRVYLQAFAGSNLVYASGLIDFAGYVTPFGAARLLGFGPWPAYAMQAIAALMMAGLIGLIWHRGMSQPLRTAALLTATLLAVPLALLYDKLLLLVAIGWLIREAREHGFLPWEKLLLTAVYPISLLTWVLGIGLHIPVGPMSSTAVLFLCIRRIWLELSARAHAAPMPVPVQALGATP